MSLTTLLNNVDEVTRRPDARARALIILNQIIQEICHEADFPEDLIEVTLSVPNGPISVGSVPFDSVNNPPIRKIEYVRTWKVLDNVKPRNAILSNGCDYQDCWYRSGLNFIVNSSQGFSELRIGLLS